MNLNDKLTQELAKAANSIMNTEATKLDKVNPKAVKKDFDDRKDKDIDNDGDVDSSDEYLHKRRKAISKATKEETELEEATELYKKGKLTLTKFAMGKGKGAGLQINYGMKFIQIPEKDIKQLYTAMVYVTKSVPQFKEAVDLGNFRDKDDYIVVIQGAGDNKQKIVQVFKGTQLDKAKKYKDDWNKKNANKIKKNKKGQPMAAHGARLYTHPADSTINGKPNIPKVGDRVSWSMFGQRVIKEAGQLKKDGYEVYESADLEEATMSQGVKTAAKHIYSLEQSLKVGSKLNKGVNKSLEGKYDADFKTMEKGIGQIINVWEEIERDYAMNESTDFEKTNTLTSDEYDEVQNFQNFNKKDWRWLPKQGKYVRKKKV